MSPYFQTSLPCGTQLSQALISSDGKDFFIYQFIYSLTYLFLEKARHCFFQQILLKLEEIAYLLRINFSFGLIHIWCPSEYSNFINQE